MNRNRDKEIVYGREKKEVILRRGNNKILSNMVQREDVKKGETKEEEYKIEEITEILKNSYPGGEEKQPYIVTEPEEEINPFNNYKSILNIKPETFKAQKLEIVKEEKFSDD